MGRYCFISAKRMISVMLHSARASKHKYKPFCYSCYLSVSLKKKNSTINDADVKQRMINLRQTLKLTVLVITFIICSLPHAVLNVLLLSLDGEHFENVLKYRRIGFIGIILNCSLNPILFVFRFRICKRQAVRLLCCFSEKALKKTSVSENSNQMQ